MEASAHQLSVVLLYEFCGSRACFKQSSTLWTIELLLLTPHNSPPVKVTVTLTVLLMYTQKDTWKYTGTYTGTYAYTHVYV